MLTCILALVLASPTLPAGQASHRIEWASSASRDTKDMRLTVGVETHGSKSVLTMSLDHKVAGAWTAQQKLTRNWRWHTDFGRFFQAFPVRVAGCLGPQVLVMSRYADSMQYEIYSVDQRWMPDVSINRTFYYRTKEIVDAKWRAKNGELFEIEVFAEKAMPEEEWARHPKKDGKTWVAHRVYRWDQDDSAWKLVKDEHKYYDLDNETMKDSLSFDTKLGFAYKGE